MHRDPYTAGYEACKKAIEKGGSSSPELVIAFSSVNLDQAELVRGIREASGNAPFVGCSDAGEITGEGPNRHGVSVMAVSSDQMSFHTGLGRDISKGAREAGQAVAKEVQQKVKESDPLRAFIMLPDVLTGNGADVVRGVLDVLGEHFPVIGGAAGDDFVFGNFKFEVVDMDGNRVDKVLISPLKHSHKSGKA